MENDAGVDARLSSDWISALASLATLVVVAITAYAAIRQMRHMRSGNRVAALLPLIEQYRSAELIESQRYVAGQMNADLENPEVRQGASVIPHQGPIRKALPFINFYESCGALVCENVVELSLLMRYILPPSIVWNLAEDYIALARKAAGPSVFENFEAIVVMEKQRTERYGQSLYPKNLPHLEPKERTF